MRDVLGGLKKWKFVLRELLLVPTLSLEYCEVCMLSQDELFGSKCHIQNDGVLKIRRSGTRDNVSGEQEN